MACRAVNHWVKKGWLQSLGLLLCLSLPVELIAEPLEPHPLSMPPLLKQTKVLACAQNQSDAQAALSRLWEIEDPEKAFPDENMLASGETRLHAATLDIVLKSLLDTSARFPELRNQVERSLLKWNYCDVFRDGTFYDLKQTSEGFERTQAAENSPENWQGFKALGFLGDIDNRFVPVILDVDQQSLRSDYEWLFHQVFREQCFPHPDTSELFDKTELSLQDNIVANSESVAGEYPYAWDPECVYPRQAPKLVTSIRLEIISLAVPELTSLVQLLPVPYLVPRLLTQVELADQAVIVPRLLTQVKLADQKVNEPSLQTKLRLQVVPPLTRDIPVLKSRVLLMPTEVVVPKLLTRLQLDKAKTVLKTPKIVQQAPLKFVDYGGNSRSMNSGNYYVGNSRPNTAAVIVRPEVVSAPNIATVIVRPEVVSKPAVTVIAQPQVVSKPNIVLNKNASLIERVLGGLAVGGNVLIVDKIQLTVNEYNGTVETAISSSDIGSTLTESKVKPALVRELLQVMPSMPTLPSNPANQQSDVISASNSAVKKPPVSLPKELPVKSFKESRKQPTRKSSPYLLVPELQSMLLVTQIEPSNHPKPVQIRSKTKKVSKPKPKKRVVAKRKQSILKKKKRGNSSSLFTYNPYPNGKKPAEKSIEQLLLEYQEYEEGRKLGRRAKKKQVDRSVKRVLGEPDLTPRKNKKRDVPQLRTTLWLEKKRIKAVDVPALQSKLWITNQYKAKPVKVPVLQSKVWIPKKYKIMSVKVPALKSKVWIQRKYKTKSVRVPSLNTMVIQQLPAPKEKTQRNTLKKAAKQPTKKKLKKSFKKPQASFEFSTDRLPDEVFEDTLILQNAPSTVTTPITIPTTTPFFLSEEAPLPYVIDEQFRDNSPAVLSASQKTQGKQAKQSKKPKKKPIGLAGNIYLKHSLKNSASAVGGSINRKLLKDSYWVARVGWNYTLEESDEPFTYSWGIGYSDWHPGTFSAQLNNWGPIKPGEGLALEKAVANFGYSVKSEFLKKHGLGLSSSINVPVEGNSSIIGNLRWSPKKNWYINASISQPLEGDGTPKWTYGFGYSDWRPNKINLQYSNYGPNEIPYHNYEDNGTWSLSYNWKF